MTKTLENCKFEIDKTLHDFLYNAEPTEEHTRYESFNMQEIDQVNKIDFTHYNTTLISYVNRSEKKKT
jgi:hypothetical protein